MRVPTTRNTLRALVLVLALLFVVPPSRAQSLPDSVMGAYAHKLEADPFDIEALSGVYRYLSDTRDYEEGIEYASRWLENWGAEADMNTLLLTYAYLGQLNMASDHIEEANRYLNLCLELIDAMSEDYMDNPYYRMSLYRVYNAYGIYYVNAEMDYLKAISYFFKGFEISDAYGDSAHFTSLGCNIVVAYYLRNDPAGLPYALRVYEHGKEVGDDYIVFCGAHVTAEMYYVLGEYEIALGYMEEALSLMDNFYDEAGLYDMYANILSKLGRTDEAETYFLKAVRMADQELASSTSGTSAYLSYGEFLIQKKDYRKAIDILTRGVAMSKDKKNTVFRYRLYQNLSSAYRSVGDMDSALDYYIMFHEEADSIFNVERERSINELRVKYEAEKKEKEIEQGKLELVRQNRRLVLIVSILIIIAILAGAVLLLYRHKNKLYIQLLRQHQETLANENRLRRRLERLEAVPDRLAADGGAKSAIPVLTDRKHEEIYARLEELMQEDHVYREKDLTVERVAKMINTNRTYLSKAINEKTGLSFNYYINSYRIEEAVRVLSDPGNDIPLKTLSYELGFHSLSTFYKLFNSVIGMPPSKFREQAAADSNAA